MVGRLILAMVVASGIAAAQGGRGGGGAVHAKRDASPPAPLPGLYNVPV